MKLRKYFALLLTDTKEALTFRAELMLWSIIDSMPLIATLVLWLSAYGDKAEIAGISKTSLIGYYVIGFIVQDITGAHFEEDVLKKIRSGEIVSNLVKPYSFKISLVVGEIGWRMMTLVSTVTPVLIISKIFVPEIYPDSFNASFLLLPGMLIMAYIMEAIYSLMVTAMGFVFEEASSLSHLKWMLGWLFSGSMMPFEFMPKWLANLASMLPFQFRYYIPVRIISGEIQGTDALIQVFFQASWLVVLVFILNVLWKRNLKAFTAVGS